MFSSVFRTAMVAISCGIVVGCQTTSEVEQVSRERALSLAQEYCQEKENLRLPDEPKAERGTRNDREFWQVQAEDYHADHWGAALILVDMQTAEVTWRTLHK